jgi:hypothetical protein
VVLLGRGAQLVLLGQAVRPEPQAAQAGTAVRVFSPLAARAKTLSTPRGQEWGRDPIQAPLINKFDLMHRSGAHPRVAASQTHGTFGDPRRNSPCGSDRLSPVPGVLSHCEEGACHAKPGADVALTRDLDSLARPPCRRPQKLASKRHIANQPLAAFQHQSRCSSSTRLADRSSASRFEAHNSSSPFARWLVSSLGSSRCSGMCLSPFLAAG